MSLNDFLIVKQKFLQEGGPNHNNFNIPVIFQQMPMSLQDGTQSHITRVVQDETQEVVTSSSSLTVAVRQTENLGARSPRGASSKPTPSRGNCNYTQFKHLAPCLNCQSQLFSLRLFVFLFRLLCFFTVQSKDK